MNGAMVNDSVAKKGYEVLDLKPDQIYDFPEGLPGFEKVKQYCLLYKQEEAPFLHCAAAGSFNLEFIVINPWVVLPEYKPEIDEADLAFIGDPTDKELIVLTTVVLADQAAESTVNLAAPMIINTKNGKGKQVIIRNFKDYSSQHKIVPSV